MELSCKSPYVSETLLAGSEMRQKREIQWEESRPALAGGEDEETPWDKGCGKLDVGSSCQRETTILVLHSQGTESYQ